ncbi:MAG: TatD family hydrolase [Promethearchaeota archaeon]
MLIDVHCHANLYLELDHLIKDSHDAGVEKVIAVAMSVISQKRILELCEHHDLFYPSLGIHPEETQMNKQILNMIGSVEQLIKNNKNKICCIGEIGLDHYFIKDRETYPLQEKVFNLMLSLAQDLKLPVNLHTKGAEKEVFELLPSYNLSNVNIHWYSGPEQFLKEGIERGYYFSITPAIKYSPMVRKTVEKVDIDHILLESDGPIKYTNKMGTPAMIKDVLREISSIKSISLELLEHKLHKNTKKIFPKIFQNKR